MSWVTVVEIEFFHLMRNPDDPENEQRFGPTPDEALFPTANTPVKALTRNGILIWLLDGTVVQGSWCPSRKAFTRRDGAGDIPRTEVRAWGALPHPIASA